MARIYKTTDRIDVKIDDISIKISPLNFEQKCEIQTQLLSGQPMDIVRAARTAIKFCVKEVSGIEDADGNPHKLEFNNGELTDSSIDDLLNLEQQEKIRLLCTTMLHGVPKQLLDPQTGKPMAGVKIERGPSRKKK